MPAPITELSLDPLTIDDAVELLEFEVTNREFFARWVGPRPVGYFALASLEAILHELLDGPDKETNGLYLLRKADGVIVGRANVTDIGVARPGHAMIGYRVGEAFCGSGTATKALSMLLERARTDRQLNEVEALAACMNPASKAVLLKNDFTQLPGTEFVELHGDDMPLERFHLML